MTLESLDEVPCGHLRTSEDGTILRANRMFCVWVGYTADELVGKRRFQDLLTMGGRIFHQTHWSPLLRMQGSLSEVKLEVQCADGSTIPMVLNALRHTHDNVPVHELAAYVARDRDRYERELVLSRRRLEDLVAETKQLHAEAKDRALFAEQMIGIVSHDLRNPLSAIMMGTALLTDADLSPAQQRILVRVTSATERANRLIEDLLDFTQARVGAGLSMSRTPIALHDVTREVVEELRMGHPGREIVHVRSGTGTCSADPSRLAQLLGNLVSNAIAYGDPASPITVTSTLEVPSASLAVHNRGPVIPAEVQVTLFQAMTRGTTAGSAARSVGLGLYIVREIARAHGGDVSVSSSADDGTRFRVVFPAFPS